MKVKVHWNRHKKKWSVGTKGLPRRYLDKITIQNARFRVQYSGWIKCQRTGIRNVHAYVVGEEINYIINTNSFLKIVYNPFISSYFNADFGSFTKEIQEAKLVTFKENGECYGLP
jgi:hypothetical protein